MGNSTFYVAVGLFILFFALILSFFGGAIIDPSWRLVAILAANSARYSDYIRDIVVYLILPPVVGLAFVMKGYAAERARFRRIFAEWPMIGIGAVFLVWGCLKVLLLLRGYNDTLSSAYSNGVSGIDGSILLIYATASIASLLWVLIGILLVYLSTTNILRKKEMFIDQQTSSDPQNNSQSQFAPTLKGKPVNTCSSDTVWLYSESMLNLFIGGLKIRFSATEQASYFPRLRGK